MPFRSGSSRFWRLALLSVVLAGCGSRGWRQPVTQPVGQPVSTAGYGVAFTHGVLAFQEGRDEDAAVLFQEAILQDPREGTARHWLGLTFLRLGDREKAVAELKASLRAERPPEAGRQRVRADLELARRSPPSAKGSILAPGGAVELPRLDATARWQGWFGIQAVRDSNPGLVPGDLPFPVFGLSKPVSDSAAQVDLGLEYQPFQGRHGWSLGLGFEGSHSVHQDLDDLDLSLACGTVSLAWGNGGLGFLRGPLGSVAVPYGNGRLSALLQGSGARVWLGGDSYLDLLEGAASLGLRESSWTATRLDLEVQDRGFEPVVTDFFRGGRETSLGVSQSFSLGRPDRYVRLGVRAGEVSGTLGADARVREALAELAVPLSARWGFYLSGSRIEEKFDHPQSNVVLPSGPARDDKLWRAAAATAYQLTHRMQWMARASWGERDSNVEQSPGVSLLDYRRTIVSTGVGWSFR